MLYMWKLMVYGVNSRRENIDFGSFYLGYPHGWMFFSFLFFFYAPTLFDHEALESGKLAS